MTPDLFLKSPAPLFDRTNHDGRAFVPTAYRTDDARSGGPGRPSGRRGRALPWTGASTASGFRSIGTSVLVLALGWPGAAAAQSSAATFDLAATIAEAAARFGLPEHWIRAVMGVESAFEVRAVSSAGAMGLMQVMPKTYAELRVRYGLGADPFHPRDNVLAGAAYLREMFDRFGAPGFLAAYNAGPQRYLEYVTDGRQLPLETRNYVAKLAPALHPGGVQGPTRGAKAPAMPAPPERLFVDARSAVPPPVDDGPAILDPAKSPIFATLGGGGGGR